MHSAQLIAHKNFRLPHRIIPAQESLAKITCANEADLQFIQRNLRWSAFHFVAAPETKNTTEQTDENKIVEKQNIYELIANANLEELAEIKGLGPKAASALIDNAKAHVEKLRAEKLSEQEKETEQH